MGIVLRWMSLSHLMIRSLLFSWVYKPEFGKISCYCTNWFVKAMLPRKSNTREVCFTLVHDQSALKAELWEWMAAWRRCLSLLWGRHGYMCAMETRHFFINVAIFDGFVMGKLSDEVPTSSSNVHMSKKGH